MHVTFKWHQPVFLHCLSFILDFSKDSGASLNEPIWSHKEIFRKENQQHAVGLIFLLNKHKSYESTSVCWTSTWNWSEEMIEISRFSALAEDNSSEVPASKRRISKAQTYLWLTWACVKTPSRAKCNQWVPLRVWTGNPRSSTAASTTTQPMLISRVNMQ